MKVDESSMTVEVRRGQERAEVLILVDHGGAWIPPDLHGLGMMPEALATHIAEDIGAAAVGQAVATALGATLVVNRVCRLVADVNRRPGTTTAIPAVSDGVVVPGNLGIAAAEAWRRIRLYHHPYHRAVAREIGRARRRGRIPLLVAVHSFTRQLRGHPARPWQVGVLWRGDRRMAAPLIEALRARGDLVVGDNRPYSGLDEFGYTIEFHAQRTGLPHVMLEIGQDEIAGEAGIRRIVPILLEALVPVIARPELRRLWDGPGSVGQPWRRPTGLGQRSPGIGGNVAIRAEAASSQDSNPGDKLAL